MLKFSGCSCLSSGRDVKLSVGFKYTQSVKSLREKRPGLRTQASSRLTECNPFRGHDLTPSKLGVCGREDNLCASTLQQTRICVIGQACFSIREDASTSRRPRHHRDGQIHSIDEAPCTERHCRSEYPVRGAHTRQITPR
jgi:hypothetical protein